MMLAMLGQIGGRISERVTGPGHLRFIIQPLIAVLLGIRDGRLDAGAGIPPYLYRIVFEPEQRRAALRGGLQALVKPLVIAMVMDGIIQVYVLRHFSLVGTLLVGGLLVGLPYALARSVTNRLVGRRAPRPPSPS